MREGRALLLVAAGLLVGVVAAILGTVDIESAFALLFVGPVLMLVGAWAALETVAAWREIAERRRRPHYDEEADR